MERQICSQTNARRDRATHAFTLVEIMFVVAVIALLAAIAVPSFLRARKRAQATHVLNDLRVLDGALDLYAMENNKASGAKVKFKDLRGYLRQGGELYTTGKDIFGNSYGTFKIDQPPKVPASTKKALSDVVGKTFWSPYR
jgi:prepilin-type N-terminal cleavage/methylation domain-containing protein